MTIYYTLQREEPKKKLIPYCEVKDVAEFYARARDMHLSFLQTHPYYEIWLVSKESEEWQVKAKNVWEIEAKILYSK